MPRNMDATLTSALSAKVIYPVVFVDLAINNDTLHIWSGVGGYSWSGNSYLGVGQLGSITPAEEGIDIESKGAQVMLSGVDPRLLNDAEEDLQLGGQATAWFGVIDKNTLQLQGTPVILFRGLVDAPSIYFAAENENGDPAEATISVPLESRLAVLGAGQQRKYSRADQRFKYPDDTSMNFVSLENYLALKWGS